MKHRYIRGFTLLEMVVAVAIIAGLSTVLSQVFLSTVRTNAKTEVLKDLKQNGDVVLETLTRSVQSAKSLTCDSQTSFTILSSTDAIVTYACAPNGSQTRLTETTNGTARYLTPETVTLGGTGCDSSTLQFVCTTIGGSPASLTVSFDLAPNGIGTAAFEQDRQSFKTSVTMRNLP